MYKYCVLGLLLTLAMVFSFANDNKLAELQITYRDTTATYLQIFVQLRDSEEIIKEKLEFKFLKKGRKAEKIYITRKEYDKGQPEIISFEPAVYNISYIENIFKDIDIKKNKLNIITLKFTLGKLSFSYIDEPNTRVKNSATVRNRDVYKGIVTQDCSDTKEYTKGNYYVEINTMPPTIFIIDIAYSSLYDLQIPKPGKLVIDYPEGVSEAVIYDTEGADWKEIISLKKAYTEQSPLLIQPRMYTIAWMKDNKRTETFLQILPDTITRFSMKN